MPLFHRSFRANTSSIVGLEIRGNMPANHKRKILSLVLLLIGVCSGTALAQQTTSFTYQGSLSPAGNYDLQFVLFDASSGGSQIGTQSFTNVNASGGTFTVLLNFGSGAFPGADRFLETSVRPAGTSGSFTTLSPRIQVGSVPYAIRAINATNEIHNSTAQQPNSNFNISGSGTAQRYNLPSVN